MRQEIKDNIGRILGTIEDRGNIIEAKDNIGRILGTYDKRTNETKDIMGRVMTRGNTLSSFIR